MAQEGSGNGFLCSNCGEKNPYPRNLRASVIRGDYSVKQSPDQSPSPRTYTLLCRYCGHSNSVSLGGSTD